MLGFGPAVADVGAWHDLVEGVACPGVWGVGFADWVVGRRQPGVLPRTVLECL